MVLLPPCMLFITYILDLLNLSFIARWIDEYLIFSITIAVSLLTYFVDFLIQKYTDTSNHLRAFYDYNVLGTKYNPHLYKDKHINDKIGMAKRVKNSTKYEVWYSEVFSDNHNANVFCCQMDNLLYAKHAYNKAKQFYFVF